MQKSFKNLEKILKKKCRRSRVYYIPNSGNWGDGLIRYGTLKFFKKINLDFTEVSSVKELNRLESEKNHTSWFPFFQKKPVVIYGGGGGWCKLWNHSTKIVNELKDQYSVIVLPSTYESTYTIPNTIFFTRDKFESKQNMPQAIFCHDMAFFIGNEFSSKQGGGTGYFFRTDEESASKINIPSENRDISLEKRHLTDIAPFFDAINHFSVIHTDRLHVSIAAALLKKEVHLYPGSYFKNKAVYLSSLQGHFKNVMFHEDFIL